MLTVDSKGDNIKEKAHNSISLILSLSSQICCPECNSEEWYRYDEYTRLYKDYTNGYKKDFGNEFVVTTYQCHDCGNVKD